MLERFAVSSHCARTRLDWAAEWLLEALEMGEVVVLGPTREAADDFVREVALAKGGLLGVHRFSPAQLAGVLAATRLAQEGLAPLSGLAHEALAARCAAETLESDRLGYFRPVVSTPGFPRALAATIAELRMESVETRRLESSGEPGRDLALLLEIFRSQLKTSNLADAALLFQTATEAAKASDLYRDLPLLMLDLRPATQRESLFLQALINRTEKLAITLLPEEIARSHWCSSLDLERDEILQLDQKHSQPTLSDLRSRLFGGAAESALSEDSSFTFFSAPGEERECVEIARRALDLAGDGTSFEQMAVLLRNPQTYQPYLEEAFSRSRIPVYFTRGTIRPDPAGRAFLALLSCAREGLSASRFAEYLSLGQSPHPDADGAPPVREVPWVTPGPEVQLTFKTVEPEDSGGPEKPGTVDLESPVFEGSLRTPIYWEQLLVDAAVIGGRDRWERRLRGLENELRLKQRKLDEEDNRRELLESQLQRLKYLSSFALPLIEELDGLPAAAVWADWLRTLRQLAARVLRNPQSVLETLTELELMAEVGPISLEEVEEVLSERLTHLRVEPPQDRRGEIFVGTIAEAAGRSFQIVFLPGLAEGVFPRKIFDDPLLLEEYRSRISSRLATRKSRQQDERYLLQVACSSAQECLVASYPRLDLSQGRIRVPSLYAVELIKAARGSLPDLKELEKSAAEASPARLGWPAPRNAENAIDSAEFDLAMVDPLLHEVDLDTTGRGHFLLHVNSHLARSLRARCKRWRPEWSDADGIVPTQNTDPEVLTALEQHRLNNRSYSPTALQSFAACPYRFLLYAINKLQPREELVPLERMDPLIRGSFFHDVQFRLFRRLKESGFLPLQMADETNILAIVDEVLKETAAEYEEELAPAIPRIWANELEDIRIDLRHWMRQVLKHDSQWLPLHFEFAFGIEAGEERDPASTTEPVSVFEEMQIRGSIDLIEKNMQSGKIRVTDHKTGKKPWPLPEVLGQGEVLQPVLYSLAAENLLKAPVSEGRLYYCTRRGNFYNLRVPFSDDAREKASYLLKVVDQHVRQGFFPAAPRERACLFCDYRPICGPYEELRTSRKKKNPLRMLTQIREIK